MRYQLLTVLVLCACGGDGGSRAALDGADVAIDGDTSATPDAAALDATDGAEDARPETDAVDASSADSGGADTTAPQPEVSDYFDPGVLLEVSIAMAPTDWDGLRNQTRVLFDILGPDCLDAPADKVFTYFPGDVTVGGITAERAGVRKKGFLGSLDSERPALRIELDELVPGQRLDGLERITLNNGRQDPSRVRQCLAYETFRAAGIAAPRCSFAHLAVNGKDLGLYVHVESVRKAFLRASFGEPLGEAWEGQLSDFRDGWLATFEPELHDDADPAPLQAVVTALAAPDATLLDALDQVVDLDQLVTFWATEVLLGHWDGYSGNTNNFFVYLDPRDERLRFVPWGTDATFTVPGEGLPVSVQAVGALAHRLYAHPEGRARYHAELRRLLAEVWDEAALLERIDAWDALTADAREPGSGVAAATDIALVKQFVQGRRAAIEAELAAPKDWPAPLREPICAKDIGSVSAAFETTWGTLAIDDLFTTGTGTLEVISESLPPFSLTRAGAKAGEDAATLPGRAQIVVAARVVGAGFVAVLVQTALPLAPGELELDHVTTAAYVYYIESAESSTFLGLLGDGAIELEAAGTTPGAAIRGSITATLFSFF